jgi:acyl-CoA ligase (AMP-forming) (exosortase A-associated)
MLSNASDILSASAAQYGDRVAVVDGPRRITYAELLERSESIAALLVHRGVRKGDRVVIFLPRSIDAVSALFAVWIAGGTAVIANEHLRSMQVRHIIEHSDCSLVVTNTRQILAVGRLRYKQVVNIDQVDSLSTSCSAVSVIGADLALLIYTSGSTGLPKGVMLSHDNLLSGTRIVSSYLKLTDRDVMLSVLPFSFDYGLNQLLTATSVGATLVLQRSAFPPDICRTLEREQITGLAGVPTLWLQLTAAHSPFLTSRFPHLRYVTNSGGRLPEVTVRQIRAAHPQTEIFLMYGLTEAFRSTYLPPEQVDCRPSSIGKAIPQVEVLVINDDGRLCAPGETGELVHRGANVALGYWHDPETTARVFRPHPLQQWQNGRHEIVVFSGDLVTMDAEGYLYYVGRKDKLIKSRGVRVSPEEIESCAYTSGLVSQVVSFAIRGDEDQDHIVLAVVPNDSHTFDEALLKAFCKKEMPEYMQPHSIWRLDAMPLTTSRKPDRRRIQQLYVERRGSTGTAARAPRTA